MTYKIISISDHQQYFITYAIDLFYEYSIVVYKLLSLFINNAMRV